GVAVHVADRERRSESGGGRPEERAIDSGVESGTAPIEQDAAVAKVVRRASDGEIRGGVCAQVCDANGAAETLARRSGQGATWDRRLWRAAEKDIHAPRVGGAGVVERRTDGEV